MKKPLKRMTWQLDDVIIVKKSIRTMYDMVLMDEVEYAVYGAMFAESKSKFGAGSPIVKAWDSLIYTIMCFDERIFSRLDPDYDEVHSMTGWVSFSYGNTFFNLEEVE